MPKAAEEALTEMLPGNPNPINLKKKKNVCDEKCLFSTLLMTSCSNRWFLLSMNKLVLIDIIAINSLSIISKHQYDPILGLNH